MTARGRPPADRLSSIGVSKTHYTDSLVGPLPTAAPRPAPPIGRSDRSGGPADRLATSARHREVGEQHQREPDPQVRPTGATPTHAGGQIGAKRRIFARDGPPPQPRVAPVFYYPGPRPRACRGRERRQIRHPAIRFLFGHSTPSASGTRPGRTLPHRPPTPMREPADPPARQAF